MRDVPQVPAFDPHISVEDVQEGLRRLSSRKARDPDQLSNWELKHLPLDCVQALTALSNAVIISGKWLKSLLSFTGAMPSKLENSFEVSQTRPIAVVSTL